MHKRLTKTILMLMFCTLFLIPAVGCNDHGSLLDELNENPSTTASAKAIKETPIADRTKELKPVTLTFLTPNTEKKDSKEVLDLLAQATKLNIKLEFKNDGFDYYDKIKTAFAANETFDAFYCGRPEVYTFDFIEMARNGQLKDISDLISQYAPAIRSQLSEEDLKGAMVDGKMYAVPNLDPGANCLSVAVRKDLMEKYKLPPIKTFEDYSKYLETIKNNEPKIIPGSAWMSIEMFAPAFGYVVLDHAQNLVYKWDDPEMKVTAWEQTPEFREVSAMVGDWIKNKYLSTQSNGINEERASFLSNGSVVSEGPTKINYGDGKDVKILEMYNYPLYENMKAQRDSAIGNVYMKGGIAFNANSPNVERTLMFLNLVQSNQSIYDLLMYGIKDRHYTLEGQRIKLPKGMSYMNHPYLGWLSSPFRNLNMERMWGEDTSTIDTRDVYKAFINNRTHYAPHEGFLPDYRELQKESQDRAQKVERMIWGGMNSSNFSTEDTQSIIQELKDAGTDKLVEEVQKQLDLWRKDTQR